MRAYFVEYDDYEGTGEAFVARTARQAKIMALHRGEYDGDYINLRARWMKNANIEGLKEGVVLGTPDAIKRGIYSWADGNCPVCGHLTTIRFSDDFDSVMCDKCEEARYNALHSTEALRKAGGEI